MEQHSCCCYSYSAASYAINVYPAKLCGGVHNNVHLIQFSAALNLGERYLPRGTKIPWNNIKFFVWSVILKIALNESYAIALNENND